MVPCTRARLSGVYGRLGWWIQDFAGKALRAGQGPFSRSVLQEAEQESAEQSRRRDGGDRQGPWRPAPPCHVHPAERGVRRLTEGLRRRLEREGWGEAIPHAFGVGQELHGAPVTLCGVLGEQHQDEGVHPYGDVRVQ